MKQKIALLLGASGSVGGDLLTELLAHPSFQKVIVFGRRPLSVSSAKLIQKIIPVMNPVELSKSVTESLNDFSNQFPEAEISAFSALGVGANTASLTIDQHRAIDVELNRSFAEALRNFSQARSLGLLSAMGANPNAKDTGSGAAGMPRYARVKGEAEEAVKKHGPKVVHIFLPAIIRGSQHTPKAIEIVAPWIDFLIPKKFHSISTREIAGAMIAASLTELPSGAFAYPEMIRLIEGDL